MPQLYSHVQGWETSPAQRIFIAVPSYDGKMEPVCMFSILNGMELLRKEGIACELHLEAGNCHVDDARNSLVRSFLATECTDLVFIDADVGFRGSNLLRLVGHVAEVVAGVYPKKGDDSWPVFPLPGDRNARNGLVEVEGAPTGFMRITRRALEQLTEAHKGRHFYGQAEPNGAPYTILFERTFEAGRRWSGDYAFCRKWRALGGKIYVDPEMDFGHVGSYTWTGRLGDHWRREAGEEPARFVEAMNRLKAGDPKIPEDFVTLHEAWGNPWAASPEFLIAAYHMAKNAKGPVLETGSGLSTLVMAAAGADVNAIEHDFAWWRRVREAAKKLGLSNVSVHLAQIDPIGGWYDSFITDTEDERFALFVCDGPPRNLGDRSYGFELPEVQDADWLIDDATEAPGRPYEAIEASKPFVVAKKPEAAL